ncbi:MAG: cobaltochelatase subunit CobS, partial [Alphaproteobacteria bacterium]|nr:cobaltochelatase subunit CobS [Alphaproteobacteria bacterium]
EFREGILPFAMQNPMMLIFNEYDAGRPDVMFVLQRVLEDNGTLTLLDQTRVIHPNRFFRIFATANTIGLGDETGLYYGTQQLNQAQLDRWHIVTQLSYLSPQHEFAMIRPKTTDVISDQLLQSMIETANRIRHAFAAQKITNVISPRAVITWAENTEIMKSVPYAFRISFLNRCSPTEYQAISQIYRESMGHEL